MHAGRTPAALQARARARYAGVGPEPGRVHPAQTRQGRSCNRKAVAVRVSRPKVCAAAVGIRVVFPGLPKFDKISFRDRSHPSESPVLTGQRRSELVALSSLRLLELDPSPAPTPPTIQYTSPRAGQPNTSFRWNLLILSRIPQFQRTCQIFLTKSYFCSLPLFYFSSVFFLTLFRDLPKMLRR
jgi:hypothetical protein